MIEQNVTIPKSIIDSYDYDTNDKLNLLDNRFEYVEYIFDTIRTLDIKQFSFVIFEEDTPERLLSLLHPDIIVKGGDYNKEDVSGREHAGEVVIFPLKKGFSTTSIINKIGMKNEKKF